MWADALRRRMRATDLEASFSAALVQALVFSKGHDAKYLPGWCGPSGMSD